MSNQDSILGMGSSPVEQVKDELKKRYPKTWRKMWQRLKTRYGGDTIRSLINQNPAYQPPGSTPVDLGLMDEESTSQAGISLKNPVVIAVVMLVVVVGLVMLGKKKK